MSCIINILVAVFTASGSAAEYDITQVLLFYQDTSEYKLTISRDTLNDWLNLDWGEGCESREIGFEFRGYIGAYDFTDCGVGIWNAAPRGL